MGAEPMLLRYIRMIVIADMLKFVRLRLARAPCTVRSCT